MGKHKFTAFNLTAHSTSVKSRVHDKMDLFMSLQKLCMHSCTLHTFLSTSHNHLCIDDLSIIDLISLYSLNVSMRLLTIDWVSRDINTGHITHNIPCQAPHRHNRLFAAKSLNMTVMLSS